MNKLITTIALALAICMGVSFNADAAVTNPVAGVVRATATGDTVGSANLPYGSKIVSVKVNPATPKSYYRLRSGSVSGAIIYETYVGSNVNAGGIAPYQADAVKFTVPSAGLYYQTDDVSSTASITIYSE